MKIAFSYHDSGLPGWNSSLGLMNSFIKKGHDVTFYGIKDPKNVNLEKLTKEVDNYDFVLFLWCGPSISFDEELKKLKLNSKAKILLEVGDEPQTYTDNQQRIKYADTIFTPDLRCHNHYISRGLPSVWLTHWCDDEIFYRNQTTEKKNICVTSCLGHRPLLVELKQMFPDRFVNKHVWGHDNTYYYNSGTFTYQFARFDEITRRIFEAGGCGNAIITNRISPETGIYDLLGEDDIAYFSTPQECFDKMNRLFNDDDYRNRLASNVYDKIIKNHLVGNRVDRIISTIREKKND